MDFKSTLNGYIELLGCNATDLSGASGISISTISRYRTGSHTPVIGSDQLAGLAAGIARLSEGRQGIPTLVEADVYERLAASISGIAIPYDSLLRNVAELLDTLDIGHSSLARALNFDASHISRILAGRRRPGNVRAFVAETSGYIARTCTEPQRLADLAYLIGNDPGQISTYEKRFEAIAAWLGSNDKPPSSPLASFLDKLDEFDLNEYIRAIHFDEIKMPTVPFQLPTSKTYYGIQQMMDAEIDFLKATVLSKSQEPVINYSDMPLEDMANDSDFPKKWMMGLAAMLKKGLDLYIIHDVNRPVHEMMLGLESWIPMYMTGQVHPYYLPVSQSTVFSHLLKTSGSAALVGEAIAGHQSEGKYYLTKSRDELAHYQLRAKRLLEQAKPLMRIYRNDSVPADFAELKSGTDITPSAFRNLTISMHESKRVVVSKNNDPIMHFVIEHPKLVHAFDNFVAPIVET